MIMISCIEIDPFLYRKKPQSRVKWAPRATQANLGRRCPAPKPRLILLSILLPLYGALHHLQRYLVCVPELVQCFGALARPTLVTALPAERLGSRHKGLLRHVTRRRRVGKADLDLLACEGTLRFGGRMSSLRLSRTARSSM